VDSEGDKASRRTSQGARSSKGAENPEIQAGEGGKIAESDDSAQGESGQDARETAERTEIMPAKSKKMRRAAAIAEHHHEQLYPENRSLLKMTKGQLHDYAATPEKGLPKQAKRRKKAGRKTKRPYQPHISIA
jgi:hypothetical protein